MGEFKGTPGPWSINPLPNPLNPNYWCVYVKPGDYKTVSHICVVDKSNHLNTDAATANTQLIAAAPELLEALQLWQAANALGDNTLLTDARIKRDIAINKALGQSPELLEAGNNG